MAELSGAQIVAKSLKTQGLQEMFGLVGVPVGPIAYAWQTEEQMQYVGVRHEQAAGYAAQAASYMHGRISAALVVSGPGMTNAISALGNAEANCWPMLLIGGAANVALSARGDFQDAPQVEAAKPFVKWADQARDTRLIPRLIAQAGAGRDQWATGAGLSGPAGRRDRTRRSTSQRCSGRNGFPSPRARWSLRRTSKRRSRR